MKTKANRGEYFASNMLYIAEAALDYFIAILISGAFLAKLTTSLGFSDSLTGIVSAFVSLGCAFQLLAIFGFKKSRVKRPVLWAQIINQSLFGLVFFVPLISLDGSRKILLFIVLLFGGYILSNLIAAPKTNWMMSLVDDSQRGRFSADKEIVSLIGGMLFSLTMGAVIDRLEAQGNLRGAFIICGVSIFVLMVLHSLTLIFTAEKPEQPQNEAHTVSAGALLKNREVRKLLLVGVLWSIAAYASTPFYGTYQIRELGFSLTFVSILSILYSVVRVAVSRPIGRFADQKGFAPMMTGCFLIAGVGFFINTFTRPENGKLLYTLYYVISAISMAGINSGLMNLVFDHVPGELRKNTLALCYSVAGVVGFLTTLAVSPLVTYIQKSGNRFLRLPIYAQQVVSAIACGLCVVLVFYMRVAYKKKSQGDLPPQA